MPGDKHQGHAMRVRCRLCGENDATCKSHIIPRRFYDRIKKQDSPLLDFDVRSRFKSRNTQSGIWERDILCPSCDGKIGEYDNYAYHVLPAKPDPAKLRLYPMNLRVYELGAIEVDRFRMFLASLAWRAGMANHP